MIKLDIVEKQEIANIMFYYKMENDNDKLKALLNEMFAAVEHVLNK